MTYTGSMELTPILTDAAERREHIRAKAVEGLKNAFPLKLRDNTIELHDVKVHTKDFGPNDQKAALLEGTSLHEPIKGTVVMRGPDGKEIERIKNFTLLHLPYFTPRHTFIVDGNEYQVSNQIRMKPGVYTRKRANEELEAKFNLLSRVSNFSLALDPKKGHPYIEYGTTTIPLYPVLRSLGVPHQDIAHAWGHDVAEQNSLAFSKKNENAVDKLYDKLVHPAKRTATTHEGKVDVIREVLNGALMDPEVNQETLGHPHDRVTPHTLIDASKKLLAVYKNNDDVDDRDSLAFKTFHSVDDFIRERIGLDTRGIAAKVKGRASNKTALRDILPAAPFTSGIKAFLTGSQLSAIPTQINPMEMVDHSVKVTSLGEGGISSERAIPKEARDLHHTHLGFIDGYRTPETFKAGVDLRTAMLAHRDAAGNLYTPMRNLKTGKFNYVSAKEMSKSVVAFPGQKMTGKVDALKNGQVQSLPASEVDYEIYHAAQLYAPTTNLIPMLESIQGNRATMGSKMQTQALPLVHREAPLVQVGARSLTGDGSTLSSWEREFAKLILPTSHVAGRVAKIDSEYIYIDPSGKKKHAEEDVEDVPRSLLMEANQDPMLKGYVHPNSADRARVPIKHGTATVGFYTPRDSEEDDAARIGAIYVQPAYRGKGLASSAIRQYMKGKPGRAFISHDNTASRRAFEAAGFKQTNEETRWNGGHWFRTPEDIERTKHAGLVKRQKSINGICFKLELEPGDIRKGTNDKGETWEKKMYVAYGYVPKTRGHDGETVDIYLKEDGKFDNVYVVHQNKKDGSHDEDKCMVGFASKDEAKETYEKHGPPWGFGSLTELTWDEFKDDYLEEHSTSKAAAEKSELIKIPYESYLPFASKTYLNHDVIVKVGDHVKEDQSLAGSNFTKDGHLALGKNMTVGYMAYYGLNSNDAVVISEGAATKMTSEHMYKEILEIEPDVTIGREIHRQNYGVKYTAEQYGKLNERGVVKKGAKVMPHDLLIVGVKKSKPSASDAILGNLKKSLASPYREVERSWGHDFEGEVMDVFESNKRIVVTVRTKEPMRIGDKLAGRYGNKGVISHIVPNGQMIQDEKGAPIDILYTSAGVISRINPAQIIETAVAKVAQKTGKPIIVENFSGRDNVKWARDLLKEHGVKDKETVYDPISGKHIPGVLVGPQYTLRLFKTTDSNYSARGSDGYDANMQPIKGGDAGAKGVGKMEFNALVAHNARNVLRETAALKSQRNDEFWRAVQLGLPLPALKTSFAYDKFVGMLQAAGIKVDKRGSVLQLQPLTDHDITQMSSGAIENEKLVRAKDLHPERGGLFDPAVTGGTTGTRWSHIDLAEPVVNPVFIEPARRLLGMTNKEFEQLHSEQGGKVIKRMLNAIDVDTRLKELRADIKTSKNEKLDNTVKQIKYLDALKKLELKPGNAYVLSKLPVLPPIMRPVLPGKGGQELVVGDSNYLYQNAVLHNKTLIAQNANPVLPPLEHAKLRQNLFQAVGAVIGTHETDNPKLEKRNVKGFLVHITGKSTPKSGFFQKKLMKRQQDISGRGTIAPDGSLGMDEVGLPEDMLWGMFGKFIIARLVRRGFGAVQAKEMVEEKHPAARDALLAEMKERPVMVNRAPSLHRYNIVGAYAVPVAGKTIRVNPFIEKGMNADYDGDTFQVHTPATHGAVEDVKRMTLSNLIFGDKQKDELMVAPAMEAVLGVHLATQKANSNSRVHKFKTKADAMAAYKRGELTLTDRVELA